MVTLHPTNIQNYVEVGDKIAKGFIKIGIEEKHKRPENLMFRIDLHADNPKPLNYCLKDKDWLLCRKGCMVVKMDPPK